jgi:hypothetical protein
MDLDEEDDEKKNPHFRRGWKFGTCKKAIKSHFLFLLSLNSVCSMLSPLLMTHEHVYLQVA